jgi:hypothetical protein
MAPEACPGSLHETGAAFVIASAGFHHPVINMPNAIALKIRLDILERFCNDRSRLLKPRDFGKILRSIPNPPPVRVPLAESLRVSLRRETEMEK